MTRPVACAAVVFGLAAAGSLLGCGGGGARRATVFNTPGVTSYKPAPPKPTPTISINGVNVTEVPQQNGTDIVTARNMTPTTKTIGITSVVCSTATAACSDPADVTIDGPVPPGTSSGRKGSIGFPLPSRPEVILTFKSQATPGKSFEELGFTIYDPGTRTVKSQDFYLTN
jgi:hypothetical protein